MYHFTYPLDALGFVLGPVSGSLWNMALPLFLLLGHPVHVDLRVFARKMRALSQKRVATDRIFYSCART